MTYEWHDLVGNCGVLLVLGTYLFVQMGCMDIRRPGLSRWLRERATTVS